MSPRRLGVSEARRLLPELVRTISRDGGRVDITLRGEPKVSILRVSDVRRPAEGGSRALAAAQIELADSLDLVKTIRELRARWKQPRGAWLAEGAAKARRPRAGKRRERKR